MAQSTTTTTPNVHKLSQSRTDMASIESFGPVSLVRFDWAPDSSGALVRLVPTSSIPSKATRNPVSRLAEAPALTLFTPAGVEFVHRLGMAAIAEIQHYQPSTELTELVAPLDGPILSAALASIPPEEITSQVFEASWVDLAMWEVDAPLDAYPMNVPISFEISARYVDLDAALPTLQAHPDVAAVTLSQGRPGGYDHVPASLLVTVKLTDSVWTRLCDYTAERYARFHPGPRVPGPQGLASEVLVNKALSSQSATENPDPLGLRPFARDHYQEPSDSQDNGYW